MNFSYSSKISIDMPCTIGGCNMKINYKFRRSEGISAPEDAIHLCYNFLCKTKFF